MTYLPLRSTLAWGLAWPALVRSSLVWSAILPAWVWVDHCNQSWGQVRPFAGPGLRVHTFLSGKDKTLPGASCM